MENVWRDQVRMLRECGDDLCSASLELRPLPGYREEQLVWASLPGACRIALVECVVGTAYEIEHARNLRDEIGKMAKQLFSTEREDFVRCACVGLGYVRAGDTEKLQRGGSPISV